MKCCDSGLNRRKQDSEMLYDYLDDKISYKEMEEHSIIATRQLAKRQMTWFRAEKSAKWYDPYKSDTFFEILDNLK